MEEINDNETIGLKSIIVEYLLQWKIFLGVFLFSIIPACLYLVLYPRTYEVSSRIQIQEDKDLGGAGFGLGEAAGLMKSFGLGSGSVGAINIEDELMMLTSNKLMREMIFQLGVNVDYKRPFSFYRLYEDRKLNLRTDSLTDINLEEVIEFSVTVSNGKIDVTAESNSMERKTFSFTSFPAQIPLPMGIFYLSSVQDFCPKSSFKMNIDYNPSIWVAEQMIDEFIIEENSKTSNVIELACTDYEKKRGVDMLNTLIDMYNLEADSYKKNEARNSLEFFDGRIKDILQELADVEHQMEVYKEKYQLTDVEHDVEFYVQQMKDLQTKLIELEAQANVVNMMEDFIKDPANKYNLVPVLLTAQEGEKGSPLITYNEVLLERARVIQNSSMDNPLVGTLTKQADELRQSVFLTINNARSALQKSIEDVKSKEQLIFDKMNTYPGAERKFIELKRQQEIIQGVYLVLLQKREETALVLGQTRDKAKVLDNAYVKSKPVGPRKLYAAIAMIFFTLVLPVVYLFIKEHTKSLMIEYKNVKNK